MRENRVEEEKEEDEKNGKKGKGNSKRQRHVIQEYVNKLRYYLKKF